MKTSSVLLAACIALGAAIYFMKQPAQQLPDDIIIIGTNSDYPPFSFKEGDDIVGFDIDLATAVLDRLNKPYFIKNMSFDALITDMQLGNIHLIASGMTPTPERAQKMFFTTPHLVNDPLLIISTPDNPIDTLEQLQGHRAVVNSGFTADLFISDMPGIEIIRLATPIEAFMELEAHHADAFVAAQSSVQGYLKHHGADRYRIATIPSAADSYALAIGKKHPQLYEQIEAVIREMHEDGSLDALKKKWNLND